MPAGRPTKYLPEYCEKLIEHMGSGYSYETFGRKVGVSHQACYDWEKKHPEFLEAKKQAFNASLEFWEEQAVKGLWNDKDGPQLNNTIWIFNMKNRFGWRDKQEIKHEVVAIDIDVEDDGL